MQWFHYTFKVEILKTIQKNTDHECTMRNIQKLNYNVTKDEKHSKAQLSCYISGETFKSTIIVMYDEKH